MSGEIDIRRRGRGRFRVRIGPVAFDVRAEPVVGGGVHLEKSFGIFVEPRMWEQVCDQIKALCRFDREGSR